MPNQNLSNAKTNRLYYTTKWYIVQITPNKLRAD
jgi:hypothetical protein